MGGTPFMDNFDRAGAILLRLWTIAGLTTLSTTESGFVISKVKMAYSALTSATLAGAVVYRYSEHRVTRLGSVTSTLGTYTACTSVACSCLLVLMSLTARKSTLALVVNVTRLRRKYSLLTDRSVVSYFPAVYVVPFVLMVIECAYFAYKFPPRAVPIVFIAYSFSIYSYIFFGQLYYHLAAIEDGFRGLCERLQTVDGSTDKLQRLRVLHHELFVLSNAVNDYLSSRVIVIIAHNFAIGVLYTFSGIIAFARNVPVQSHIIIPYWLMLFYWASSFFFGLYILVQPCEAVRSQAHRIAIGVQSLSTRPGYSQELYDELRLFSSQLILENVTFAPHNLLVLNKPLLLSTFGAVGSSVAILLQVIVVSD